jgi:hypothetical protein
MLPFVLLLPPPLPSSSSSGMKNLDGWMTRRMTRRMDGKDDHQGYYISRCCADTRIQVSKPTIPNPGF